MKYFASEDNLFKLVTVDDKNCTCLPVQKICKEFIKKEQIQIPKQKPKVEQLSKIIAKPEITSYNSICIPQGKQVVIKGQIIKKVFYVADKPKQSIYTTKFTVPFCTFVKLPKKITIKDIKVKIEDIKVQLINQKKINQYILLFICVTPTQRQKLN